MPVRCGACGNKELIRRNSKGTKHPYKEYEAVELTVDIFFNHSCSLCGNVVMSVPDVIRLDAAIVASLRMQGKPDLEGEEELKNEKYAKILENGFRG